MDIKTNRISLRLSQSELSRRSGVRRERICLSELGDFELTLDEQERIREALATEACRIGSLAANFQVVPASGYPIEVQS